MTYSSPSKRTKLFLLFEYADTALYVTSASQNQELDGQTWLSEPAIEVKPGEQTGGVEDKEWEILLPMSKGVHQALDDFAAMLAAPQPTPRVDVLAFEVSEDSDKDQERTYLAEGVISTSRRNPNKNAGIVEISVQPSKNAPEGVPLGIASTAQCANTFGRNGCWLDNSQYATSANTASWTSTNFIGRVYCTMNFYNVQPGQRAQVVELLNDPTAPGQSGIPTSPSFIQQQSLGWWLGGYIEKDGVAIEIRDWMYTGANNGTNIFVLNRIPPLSWAGQRVTLVTGCLNTLQACQARNNEINFNAVGYSMPAFNPLIEEGK